MHGLSGYLFLSFLVLFLTILLMFYSAFEMHYKGEMVSIAIYMYRNKNNVFSTTHLYLFMYICHFVFGFLFFLWIFIPCCVACTVFYMFSLFPQQHVKAETQNKKV